jgi:hypothetical protein
MPERDAWSKLRPVSGRQRHQLRVICGYVALIAAFVALIFFVKERNRADLEKNWTRADAVIVDVRTREAARVNTSRGGAMLYDVEILAKYRVDGSDQERWIIVEQQPEGLPYAQLQAFRWKGKQCVVRWKPSEPDRIFAEVS